MPTIMADFSAVPTQPGKPFLAAFTQCCRWFGTLSSASVLLLTSVVGCRQEAADAGAPLAPASTASVAADGDRVLLQVESEPDYACRWSFEQTKRMVEQAGGEIKTTPEFPSITLPEYDSFMHSCLEYPREVQKCLVFEYVFANAEKCKKARTEYDEENQRRFGSATQTP